MANRTKFTPTKREQFLKALAETCNVTGAARSCGMSRPRLYGRRKADAEFAAAREEAEEIGIDALEGEAWRRALEGVDEPIVHQGEIMTDEEGKPLAVKKHSDTLIMFLLKGHRPEKYRERIDNTHRFPDK